MQQKLSCNQANQIDLVDYLAQLGYTSKKIIRNDHWFLSPFRDENTPSFKVNRQLNVWYDHGIGKGGRLVDFGIAFHQCTVSELLHRLSDSNGQSLSFHQPQNPRAGEKKNEMSQSEKIQILGSRGLSHPALLNYLQSRKISVDIARNFCREIDFQLNQNNYFAIGFPNSAGGYELRSLKFKGSSAPKSTSLILESKSEDLFVFEGFFNFLSFQMLQRNSGKALVDLPKLQPDFLVLNSLSFFEKSREVMEKYAAIHLCLDRDKAGLQATAKALLWSDKYKDLSKLYSQHNDLNEYLVNIPSLELKKSQRQGRHL
ncbi:MAG: DNA primase [Chitinophagaceae bacterium]|nr:MAG: DNA primase [Chitinophagaceae bacterium]